MSKKVLIVDDDADILDAIGMLLEDADYRVEKASKWSRNQLGGELPDLILLDIYLSGQDGREIAKKLKAGEKTRNIPIIMMSAHPTMDDIAAKTGVSAFLAKPFDADDLLKACQEYVK